MHRKEVKITFPRKFLESLVSGNLTPRSNTTRGFIATIEQKSTQSKQCHCEIFTTTNNTSIEIHLKSDFIHIKEESFSLNIKTWSEINDYPDKIKNKGCRRPQRLKRSSVLHESLDSTCDDNISSLSNSISYYINKIKSPKRKLNDSSGHIEPKKKLKLSPDKRDTCETSASTCNVDRDEVGYECLHENEPERTSTLGPEADYAVDFQGLSVCGKSHHTKDILSTSTENEVFEKSQKDKNKQTDSRYFSIREVIQNVDINLLTVNTSDAPDHLKPVSLGNVDLKVSVGNALIATTPTNPVHENVVKTITSENSPLEKIVSTRTTISNTIAKSSAVRCKSSKSILQPNSTLFVEETEIPVFYIHGTLPLQNSILLGPFVLETSPVPHLRLKMDCQFCYRLPKEWNFQDGNRRVMDDRKGEKNEEISYMPPKKQLRRSTLAHRSLHSYISKTTSVPGKNQTDEGRDVVTGPNVSGNDSDVASRTAAPLFVEEDRERDTRETGDQTSAPGEDVGRAPVQKAVNMRKKKKERTVLKKCPKKTKSKLDKTEKVKQGREATPQKTSDTDEPKSEDVAVNGISVKKLHLGKQEKCKKKKVSLSKRGGMDSVYKRMSSYCTRIIPETGSDLWEPVSDLSLVVSTCKFCPNSSKSFPDHLILADHIRNIHKKEANYMETVRECRAKMKLKCNLCVQDRFYSRWESFGIHMRDMHSEKCGEVVNLLKCTLCKKTWVNRYKFDRHMETVHGNSEKFLCHLCPQTFKWESSLRCHIKGIHDKETSHICEICGAVFSRKRYVRVHWQKYHGEKSPGIPHRSRGIHCSICDLRLEKKKDITSHMVQVHQLEDNHVNMKRCKICKSNFASQEGLEKHTTDCHSTKQYQHCPYCGSGFQARDNMLRHIAKDHLKISPPKCPLCEKQFDYNTDLRFHLRKQHGYGDNDHTYGQADNLRSIAILKCEYCDKPFFWVMGLINHMLCHADQFPYECEVCGQRFKEGSSLQHHIAFRHIKASQCEEVRTPDAPVGTDALKSANSEQDRNTEKDRRQVMVPTSSMNQEQARKGKVDSLDPKAKTDKKVQPTPKEPVLKTPYGLTFQSPHEGIQVPVPDVHGTFASGSAMTRKNPVPATLDKWNYPTGHWSVPSVQHHHAVTHRDYINHDSMTRAEEPVYHVLDYVRETASCHPESAVVRSLHPLTAVQTDQGHLRHIEHATLQPEQVIGDRRDVHGISQVSDRGIVHVSTANVADRNVLHASTVNAGASNVSSSEPTAVNASGEGGGTQLITAENLIGLLHEFNSQQQQTNQYFSPQFF